MVLKMCFKNIRIFKNTMERDGLLFFRRNNTSWAISKWSELKVILHCYAQFLILIKS